MPLTFNIKHQPSVPVGQLWVELLRFYALEFNLADLVISIRVKELISRESKDWPKKRIAIEGNNVGLLGRGASNSPFLSRSLTVPSRGRPGPKVN